MAEVSPGDAAPFLEGPAPAPARRPRVGVVLAAGRSERLRDVTGGGSKALVRVGGLALVERQIRRLLSLGMERVVVVVGYHAGPVAAVARHAAPGRVQTVVAPDWEEGNAASLAAAEESLEGEESFLLVTADHLFSDDALDPLLERSAAAVLVDPEPGPEVWGEATRVEVDAGGRVVALGKHVASPIADCGAFVLGKDVFDSVRIARAARDSTLAGAVSRLGGLAAVTLPPGAWWQDVDTPSDLRVARRLLRRSLRRPSDGPVSRLFNRRISVPISWVLASIRPSPDILSALAFGVGLAAAASFAVGSGVLGAVLAQACSVLDGVDGEVARLTASARARGSAIDGFLDRIGDAAIAAGLGAWATTAVAPGTAVMLVAAAVCGAMLSMATKDRLAANGLRGPSEEALGWLLGGRDGRLLTVAVFGVLGLPMAALAVTAATSLLASALRTFLARPA